ncbi:nuclear transport factor 2 family protein [Aromatoleum anaerobium]|uniref:Nuclear transport factor 2 family protein n=1 Tax=Aromatoleum anaerobium TaxID=182180 RepID=A0ABX1PKT7_9RHOO|nr:nuclear transport factor 2 family protein [Aromatoleum anaerobium]MCK0508126.1 nuclear transport factor 2 family protein [Aromatoleum anaerobium]
MSKLIAATLAALILSSGAIAADKPKMNAPDAVMQQVRALQAQVQELRDIEEIRELKHAYFRGIDSADLDLLRGLMHPAVTVHFIGGDYEWKLAGRDQYLEAIGNNFNSEVIAQHNGHHPEIKILSPTQAEGTWYLHDNFYNLREKLYTTGTAFYHDRYLKVDGKWLLRSTEYKRHYEIVEKLDKLPNITVDYLARHGRKVARHCHGDGLCRDDKDTAAAVTPVQ